MAFICATKHKAPKGYQFLSGLCYLCPMETFKKNEAATYKNLYQDMIADIDYKIKYFQSRNGLLPNFIIVSTTDMPHLVKSAQAANMLPSETNELSIIQSARLMPSEFMHAGSFDVVGN